MINVYPNLPVTIGNQNRAIANVSTDAFARLRISNPTTLFDMMNQYDTAPLLFWSTTVGTGAITALPNEASVQMSTGGTASGAKAVRQTKQYFRYQPGKSQLVLMTRNVGVLKTNVRQRWGLFDDNNGYFFEQDGVNLKVVVRTSTSGSPLDSNAVNQSAWNVDKLDGTGPSGIVLNTAMQNLYFINYQWLGTGVVNFGIFANGVPVVCHTFYFANILTTPYNANPNLPLRNELENTGVAASLTTMKATCNAVISEGGVDEQFGYDFSVGNGITTVNVTARRAVLSIRPKATFGGLVNRADIDIEGYNIYNITNDTYFEIVYNPVFTGTPTWTSVNASSATEFSIHGDAAAGAFTGGITASSGFAGAGKITSITKSDFNSKYPLVLDPAGANPIAISIVITPFTSPAGVSGTFDWREEY